MQKWYNLLTGEGIAGYMSEAEDARDWNHRARIVRRANQNRFPLGWYSHVINTNLAATVARGWERGQTHNSLS